jgi:hypothetical protein
MKRLIYIAGLIMISFVDLLGQTREEQKEQLKGLIGTDYKKLRQLNSRDFMTVFGFNEELERGIMYTDSAAYSIDYFISSIADFKDIKLIEFQSVKVDTSKNKSMWVRVVRVWTKQDGPKEWNFNRKEIQIKLPATFYSYVGVQKLNGESVGKLIENPLPCKPITINLDKKRIRDNEVVVVYFESDEKVYIAFHKE